MDEYQKNMETRLGESLAREEALKLQLKCTKEEWQHDIDENKRLKEFDFNKETKYGPGTCRQCGEPTPLPGEHRCNPTYSELQAKVKALEDELEQARSMIAKGFNAAAEEMLKPLQAQLTRKTKALEKYRWIPVSERLPDRVRTMRVLLKADAVKKLCENHGFYGEDENGWGWVILGQGILDEVTHWQEKQELPWEALQGDEK